VQEFIQSSFMMVQALSVNTSSVNYWELVWVQKIVVCPPLFYDPTSAVHYFELNYPSGFQTLQ
jgi:hypothetical protein